MRLINPSFQTYRREFLMDGLHLHFIMEIAWLEEGQMPVKWKCFVAF